MLVFLVGYMGSGKTTYGKFLTASTGIPFIDMDNLIEEAQQCKISDIFAQKGEAVFRQIEKETLHYIIGNYKNTIVATGGGAPCFFDNMETINRNGLSIYLKWNVSGLVSNLYEFCADRPLLKDKSPEELTNFIAGMLEKREPFYNMAHFHFDAASNNTALLEKKIRDFMNY